MMEYEIVDLRRREDGTLEAHIVTADSIDIVREVKSVEIEATVHRGPESQDMGLPATEDLGLVAATYSNPASEMRARRNGVGRVEVGASCE